MRIKNSSRTSNMLSVILFLLCVLIFSVSCTPGGAERDLVDVTLAISVDKTLETVTNRDIWYWEFMATPKFSLAAGEGKEVGRVDYWRQLTLLTTNADGTLNLETSLGKYMQGEWYFELRALNKRGHVIAIGQTKQYISKIQNNVVNISVYPDSSDGTHGESMDDESRITGVTATEAGTVTTVRYGNIKVGLIVNQLEDSTDDMRITVSYQKMSKGSNLLEDTVELTPSWSLRKEQEALPLWYVTDDELLPSTTAAEIEGDSSKTVPEGKLYYETDIEMDAGIYMFTFNIETKKDDDTWQKINGQTLSVTVTGGEQSEIRGNLTATTYIVSGIVITVPGSIYGSINGEKQIVSAASEPVTLTWTQSDLQKENSSEEAVDYTWYVDGIDQNVRNESFVFNCPKDESGNYIYGVYRVSLVPLGTLNSWGFTDIDIVFTL